MREEKEEKEGMMGKKKTRHRTNIRQSARSERGRERERENHGSASRGVEC